LDAKEQRERRRWSKEATGVAGDEPHVWEVDQMNFAIVRGGNG
jgi:hypothetical protein